MNDFATSDLAEPLLKEADVANLINVCPATLEMWRSKRIGPRYIRLNGCRAVRYRPCDVCNRLPELPASWLAAIRAAV